MTKDFKSAALESLMFKAKSDKASAQASLTMLLDHPAGIGDHSTQDLYNNLNEALTLLAEAADRVETLKRNFPNELDRSNRSE